MAHVLAIDVGLLNLSVCCCTKIKPKKTSMRDKYDILFWDLINVIENDGSENKKINLCGTKQKNGKICNKKAKYSSSERERNEYFCKMHSKTKDTQSLKEIKIKKVKVKQLNFQQIAERIITHLNSLKKIYSEEFSKITKILIELQPNKNNKMKFTSHIIFGKLIDMLPGIPIRFIGAKNKLKHYRGPATGPKVKNTYSNRKKMAIDQGQWYMEQQVHNKDEWNNYLDSQPKKDDLFDAFRYCVNELGPIGEYVKRCYCDEVVDECECPTFSVD